MPKLKTLSGGDVVRIFESFGFSIANQRGSHVKLWRNTASSKQTITIPLHDELDKGTIKGIYAQGLRYIPERDLRAHFYSE